jgi:AbrB family looped-hinge helix DNA binding protein
MKITRDGKVTIPREVRERLGLVPGTEVEWSVRDGGAVLRRCVADGQSPGRALVQHMRGRATVRMGTDEIMELTRGEA